MDNFFKEIIKRIPKKIRNYNRLSMGIAGRIDEILEERKISQREFANKMKKSESEISKWMSGKHNFTIKSIANIEAKLDIKLIYTEYDLEDIKTKLDKEQKYLAFFENFQNDAFIDTFGGGFGVKCEYKFEESFEPQIPHMVFAVGDFCDANRRSLVVDNPKTEENLFESIKDIVGYNQATNNLEVKA